MNNETHHEMRGLAVAALLLALATPARATAPVDVPDPRPTHHVVDLTATLEEADIAAIDRAAARAGSDGELLVVVVPSVDGAVPREWTTALFNRLELGKGRGNRGVLLMAAVDDRRAEIVLGDGYPAATTSATDRVMRDVVVAHFRGGDPSGALVAGADALVDGVVLPGVVADEKGAPAPSSTATAGHAAHEGADDDAFVMLALLLSVLGFMAIVAVGLWLADGNGDGGSSSLGSSSWSDSGSSSSSSDSGSSSGSGSSGDW